MPYSGTPSRWLYLLALAPVVAGAVASYATDFGGLDTAIQSMPRFVVPGEHALDLERGPYTVFYERRSVIDDEHMVGPEQIAGLHCAITDPFGQPERLVSDGIASSYELGSFQGASLFGFEADVAGRYLLRCAIEGQPEQRAALALGGSLAPHVMKAVGLPLGGLMLGVIVFAFVFVLRRKAGRPTPR